MKIKVHFKNGLTATLPITKLEEIDKNFFSNFQNTKSQDKDIVVFGTDGSITRKAKDVESFEFTVSNL